MIRFDNDYAEGAHPLLLQRLIETNEEQTSGYGTDSYTAAAKAHIQAACNAPDADVHFLVGGTQTNLTVIGSILRPYQGVLSSSMGHIATHETGAIEATGHKVLTLPSTDGKIIAQQVTEFLRLHFEQAMPEHEVQPGMVYISHPTEVGTCYTREELVALSKVCFEAKLPLFVDGARLGYGLVSDPDTVTLDELAALCDVFYIGGTKVGALFGEAIVITNDDLKTHFRYAIKQRGALLAKGRLLGVQFEALFEEGLYEEISNNAVTMALRIREAFEAKGIQMQYDSYTNQQFPILTNEQCEVLAEDFSFTFWEALADDNCVVRFCTSWATKAEQVEKLLEAIEKL